MIGTKMRCVRKNKKKTLLEVLQIVESLEGGVLCLCSHRNCNGDDRISAGGSDDGPLGIARVALNCSSRRQ